jgi:hypothetical protein
MYMCMCVCKDRERKICKYIKIQREGQRERVIQRESVSEKYIEK